MNLINSIFEKLFLPLIPYSHYLLRFALGISFFLHGYGKLPISDGFIGWLDSQGVIYAELFAYLIAWGEMISGIGIILGGILTKLLPITSSLITRFSAGTICVIMICALIIAHSDWSIFTGERGKILFASEQLFLLTVGLYFLIIGNKSE